MRYFPNKNVRVFFLKNYIPGCNLLFNRILIQQAFKTDNIMNLHDHWLLMVCSSVGKISYIKKPLMKYRQHKNNAIGFIEREHSFFKTFSLFLKDVLKYGLSNKKYRELLYSKNIEQMQNICESIPQNITSDAIAFSQIHKSNYFIRKIKNISQPYILERSPLKQLTYIICF